MYENHTRVGLKIKKVELISALVMFSCINIEFLNIHIPGLQTATYYLRCALICIVMWKIITKKIANINMHVISRSTMLTIVFLMLVVISSLYNGQKIVTLTFELSYVILPVLFIDAYRKSRAINSILRVWERILLVLILIDALTMVLMPGGLYISSSYGKNWFLGYKTLRLIYSLPLCVFSVILDFVTNNKNRKKTYFIFILSIITLLYSQASAAAVGLLSVFSVLIVCDWTNKICLNKSKAGHRAKNLINKFLSNYIWIIPLYFLAIYALINIANLTFMQVIVEKGLNKDITLTNRTVLWSTCIDLIGKHRMLGYGYLSPDNYRELFNNVFYTSPHNLILSLFMTVGGVGTIIYLFIIIDSMRKLHRKNNIVSIVLLAGIICNLIVGLTSSIMLFCFCGFIFETLSEVDFDNIRALQNCMR